MSDLNKYLSEGWITDQLVNLVDVRVSNVDKKSLSHQPPVRLCNYMDVYSNDYITSSIDFMNATAEKSQISRFIINRGDVMITKDSETPDDIGITAVSLEDFENVVCGYHLALLKPYKDKICGEFLAKQLGQYKVNRQFANKANGSTRYGLTLNVIKSALIPFPVSVEKQQKIAHILTTCDTVIAETQSATAKYKAIKQGMLHDLFTRGLDANGKLRPSFHESPKLYKSSELGMIPKDWEVKRLEECTTYVDYRGKTPPKSDRGIVLVTAKNIRFGFIDYELSKEYIYEYAFENAMSRGKASIGDVLITTEAPMGNVAQIDKEGIALAQRVIKYQGYKDILNNDFLKLALMSDGFQKTLLSEATGSTALGIKGSRLHKLKILIPQIDEQKEIAKRVKIIDIKIQTEEALLQKYQSIKRGLMGDLLSGEKDIESNNNVSCQ